MCRTWVVGRVFDLKFRTKNKTVNFIHTIIFVNVETRICSFNQYRCLQKSQFSRGNRTIRPTNFDTKLPLNNNSGYTEDLTPYHVVLKSYLSGSTCVYTRARNMGDQVIKIMSWWTARYPWQIYQNWGLFWFGYLRLWTKTMRHVYLCRVVLTRRGNNNSYK